MTMEASLVGKKRNNVVVGNNHNIIRKKRCITTSPSRRRTKRCNPPPPPSIVSVALQKLFVACRDVFKGPAGTVPPPQDIQKLRHILDNMKPEDVGLSRDLLFFKSNSISKGTPSITYTTIYKCENFSMCLFFLPPSGVIPLHNHPEMTVFSKLLFGSMHIKSYDWADDPVKLDNSMPSSQLRLARLKVNTVFTAPCNASVLYPTSGGNIHEFTAITPCAVLDVLGPPYSKREGRDCSYYKDFPCSISTEGRKDEEGEEGRDCYGWLEETEMPKDLKMEGIEYLGPQVIETPF